MHRWKSLLVERFASVDKETARLGFRSTYRTRYVKEEVLPRAAVAFIIKASKEDLLYVLLTKRSSSLRNYAGDVCLPGGRYDPSDHSLVETALRETKEEVGIESRDLDYIGTMLTLPAGIDQITAVTPVVFLANNELNININTSEVEMAFWVPLDVFFNENTRMPRLFRFPVYTGISGSHVDIEEKKFSTTAFNYYDVDNQTAFLIWGFTARVCITAASVALNKSPHFPFTVLTLLYSPDDGNFALAEIIFRWSTSHVTSVFNTSQHNHLHSKL